VITDVRAARRPYVRSMSDTIIAAVDLDAPRQARDALAFAAWLADVSSSKLAAATVFVPRPGALSVQIDHRKAQLATVAGRPIGSAAMAGTSPARLLHELADQRRPLAVVIGSSRGGAIGRVSLGSVGQTLLHGGDVPIVVTPNDYEPPLGHTPVIGVGDAGTPESHDAVRAAARLATRAGAALRVLNVLEPSPHNELAELRPGARLELALDGVPAERVELDGDPPTALADAANDLDLLIVGSRSYGPLGAVLLGAVTRQLIHAAPCPLMVVPRVHDAAMAVALIGGMEAPIET
jgi:nucleotide-binding universal stress UspA family protein